MSTTESHFIVGSKVLAYYGIVATWRRNNPGTPPLHRRGPSMIIQSCASTDEGVHEPAQSISINTRQGLLDLRDAIDEALKEDQP